LWQVNAGTRGAVLLALLATACTSPTRTASPGPPTAVVSPDPLQAEIAQNLETARWMMDYDRVAWATTDLLLKESKDTLKRVGPTWFCLKQDDAWYTVYGDFDADAYQVAVCYREVAKDKFEKVAPPVFADAQRFARAIRLTLPDITETTRRTTVRFNYYVRAEGDRIALYYLPAFQTDGKLAYGIQHTFHVDATGRDILMHEHHGNVLVGLIPNKSRLVMLECQSAAFRRLKRFLR
jgi:hypothetical protein